MLQARSEWRHIRLIFDHAEGPLIRFAHSLSWVLCCNYHNCSTKHACLYGCRVDVSVCGERGIPTPNPINAGWMAGPTEGEQEYREEEGEGTRWDAGPTHRQGHTPGLWKHTTPATWCSSRAPLLLSSLAAVWDANRCYNRKMTILT